MSGLKTAKFLERTGTYITPAGRLVDAALFRPTAMGGESEVSRARYRITLLLPAAADVSAMERAAARTRDETWPGSARRWAGIRSPFLQTTDSRRLADHAGAFPLMLRFQSMSRPGVLSKSLHPMLEVDEPDEIYDGRWARVTCAPFAYDRAGRQGVSFGLGNVQILDHDARIVLSAGAGSRTSATTLPT